MDLFSAIGVPTIMLTLGQLAASAKAATIGPQLEAKIRSLSHPVSQKMHEWRDSVPSDIKDSTNHDLRRALAKSFVLAAEKWRKELRDHAGLPENGADARELTKFCERVRIYLTDLGAKASRRSEKFDDPVSTDAHILALLDVAPLSGAEDFKLAHLARELSEGFITFIQAKEGQAIPEQGFSLLHKTYEPDGFSTPCRSFGYAVIEGFLECLKSGDYPQATIAFEIFALGDLRRRMEGQRLDFLSLAGDVVAIKEILQDGFDRTLLD
jgi:hypothetical protein